MTLPVQPTISMRATVGDNCLASHVPPGITTKIDLCGEIEESAKLLASESNIFNLRDILPFPDLFMTEAAIKTRRGPAMW